MAQLINKSKNQTIAKELKVADNFVSRAQGLIGTKELNDTQAIWFPKSNWIHTCFMSIPIDVIYLDKEMIVTKLQPNLKPWRFPAPVFKAQSVVEAQVNFIDQHQIEIGDAFHVGD